MSKLGKLTLAAYAAMPLALLALGGCKDDGPMEDAGEAIDEAAEEVGDEIDDATDDD